MLALSYELMLYVALAAFKSTLPGGATGKTKPSNAGSRHYEAPRQEQSVQRDERDKRIKPKFSIDLPRSGSKLARMYV